MIKTKRFWLRKVKFLLIFIIFFSFTLVPLGKLLFSQSTFQVAIGGINNNYAYSITHTTDGGYVAAGITTSYGAGMSDFYIVKLDSIGSIQWTRTVGGTNIDNAYSIIQTTDGGYAVAGYTTSFGAGDYDMYIVKLSANGLLQWNKTIGGTGHDIAESIIQTAEGGYAVAGWTTSFGIGDFDLFIVKLNTNGSFQWSKTVSTGDDGATSIIQTTDGGYAVVGSTLGDIYIVKLDANDSLQWSKTIGGTDIYGASSIIQTNDGGYVVAGYFNLIYMYIVKLDANCSLQWNEVIGGTTGKVVNPSSIIQTSDGGYAVGGYTTAFGEGNYDMYIVKLSANGSLQWNKTIGGTFSDDANSITQATDGGYVLAGSTGSFGLQSIKMYIVKLNPIGITCGNTTTPNPTVTIPTPIVMTPRPTITSPIPVVTTPKPVVNSGGTETIFCTTVGLNNMQSKIPSEFKLYQNYPNPFGAKNATGNPTTKIKFDTPLNPPEGGTQIVTLEVYDLLGRKITTLFSSPLVGMGGATYEVEWDATNFPSGIYFYKLSVNVNATMFTETKRMVLMK